TCAPWSAPARRSSSATAWPPSAARCGNPPPRPRPTPAHARDSRMQQDKILIETTKTHRARLASALSYGPLGRRRPVNTNAKRFIGSVVLAAVAGVGCMGYGFVSNLLLQQRENAALASFQQAMASNPLPETETRSEERRVGKAGG